MERAEGPDNLMVMFDKLQIMNLSMEGAELLKSMADAIRSALEKGLLLEQLIINQRNNAFEKSVSGAKSRDSSNKERSDNLLSDEPALSFDEAESKNIPEKHQHASSNNTTPTVQDNSYIGLDQTNIVHNQPDVESTTLLNGVRLVSPSLLIGPNLSTLKLESNESYTDENINKFDNCHNSNLNRTPNSSNITINPELRSDKFNTQSMPHLNIPDVSNQVHSDSSSYLQSSDMSSNNSSCLRQVSQDDYEQPAMPSPIVIKSEFIATPGKISVEPELFIPISSNEENTKEQINEGQSKELDGSSPYVRSEEHKIFVEMGKDATEEDVVSLFNGLEITYIKIVNRPLYSFGFISFATEVQMKAALEMNDLFFVKGKAMRIRPCYEDRKLIKLPSQSLEKRPLESKSSQSNKRVRSVESLAAYQKNINSSTSENNSPPHVKRNRSDLNNSFSSGDHSFTETTTDCTSSRDQALSRERALSRGRALSRDKDDAYHHHSSNTELVRDNRPSARGGYVRRQEYPRGKHYSQRSRPRNLMKNTGSRSNYTDRRMHDNSRKTYKQKENNYSRGKWRPSEK